MFKTRLLSGILLVLIALVAVISGGRVLFGVVLCISLIGMSELYKVFGVEKKGLGIAGYLAALLYYLLLYLKHYTHVFEQIKGLQDGRWFTMFCMLLVMGIMSVYVFTFPTYRTEQVLGVFFGVFYVAVMLSYIFQTRLLTGGIFSTWLVFFSSWGCDTCAYCVGKLLGKHKMSQKLSPKKSIEGAVGGVLGAALLGTLYALAINQWTGANETPWIYAVVCGVGGLISMVGDLAASAIKRNYEIKDYGKLIPGHGGILDRFDSVIFTAPIIYYLIVLMQDKII